MTLMILSPAKSLDMSAEWRVSRPTQPRMLEQAQELVTLLRRYSKSNIKALMKISDSLASLNTQRYREWSPDFNKNNAKPAVLAFTGDVYQGLEANSLTSDKLKWLQGHCRILSGLYGVLRPLDLMKAYRLEMGTGLKTDMGSSLYQFWGDSISELLNKDLNSGNHDALVNLASNEYFKSVKPKALNKPVITPVFKEERAGVLKVISFNAKRARGKMVRFAVDNNLNTVNDLKQFNIDGYRFDTSMSSDAEWFFIK